MSTERAHPDGRDGREQKRTGGNGLPGICPACGRILKIRVKDGKAVCVCPGRDCGYTYESA